MTIYIMNDASDGKPFDIYSIGLSYTYTTLQPSLTSISPTQSPQTQSPTSQTPTNNPTNNSTRVLTIKPTQYTQSPQTQSPTSQSQTTMLPTTSLPTQYSVCNTISLTISYLEGLSTSKLNQDSQLQLFISNITTQAIISVVILRGINPNSFFVQFETARLNIVIIQKLCSFNTHAGLQILSDIFTEESISISLFIQTKIIAYFKDDNSVSTDKINISVSLMEDTGLVDISTSNVIITNITSSIGISKTNKAEQIPSLYIACGIISAYFIFAMLALVDSKYLRQNDYYMPEF
eukprot:513376_1